MTDRLILVMGQTPDDPVLWALAADGVVDEIGRSANVAALDEVAERAGEDTSVAVVLPGEQAAMKVLPHPPKSAAKARSASILLLEDELAEEADSFHAAVQVTTDAARAFAINRSLLRGWLDALSAQGVEPDTAIVDFDCLGGTERQPIFFHSGDRIIANLGGVAFTADETLASFVVQSLQIDDDAEISSFGDQKTLFEITQRKPSRTGRAEEADLLTFAAQALSKKTATNLLQGEFRRKRNIFKGLAQWRRPAALAASVAACALILSVVDGVRAGRIAERYETAAQSLHTKAFPEAAGQDMRRHARTILSQQSAGATFLQLSELVANVVDGEDRLAIDRIRFDAARGLYVMAVRSESQDTIETFRKSLAEVGVIGEDNGGYRRSGAAWVGEMTARMQ